MLRVVDALWRVVRRRGRRARRPGFERGVEETTRNVCARRADLWRVAGAATARGFGSNRTGVYGAASEVIPVLTPMTIKRSMNLSSHCFAAGLIAAMETGSLSGQRAVAASSGALPEPLNWTTQQDHQNMKEQLGIKALRPGPSGRTGATNEANYDPATANPYPDLPDPLTLKNGQKVATADVWWKQRRPEIVEDFEREVVGRGPRNV